MSRIFDPIKPQQMKNTTEMTVKSVSHVHDDIIDDFPDKLLLNNNNSNRVIVTNLKPLRCQSNIKFPSVDQIKHSHLEEQAC